MSKKESLRRISLVVSKLKRSPMNFEQLQDFLQLQEEISEEKLTCSQRTFQRDIKEIASLYDIQIIFDRSAGVYKIEDDGREGQQDRIVESFEIFNALQLSNSLSGKMILEKRKPLGTEYLHGLLHAINHKIEVEFDYEKFYEEEKTVRQVKPIAIKEARNRWYLLAQEEETVKSFGLDRIKELEFTQTKFEPIKFNAEEDYKYSFGIINAVEKEPQRIVLCFTPEQAKYISSFPLHHSQNLIFKNEKEVQFEFFLFPSYDFIMEILSYGQEVKVLEPKNVRDKVKNTLSTALKQYN